MSYKWLALAAILAAVLMFASDRKQWKLPPAGVPYRPIFEQAAADFDVPAPLLERVAQQESHFDTTAHNAGSDASGIMQLVPRWYPGVDPFDPSEAIPAAANSLRTYYDQFGSWPLALAAYNWGPGNLSESIAAGQGPADWPRETQNYVSEITADVGFA